VRWRHLEQEFAGRVELCWRSFLLRPEPVPGRDLERFRSYTRSWQRPAADADAGEFRVWQGDEGPPSHSIPAHLAAKAAARVGKPAFDRLHERMLRAYFSESRDISAEATLLELWSEVGLPRDAWEATRDPVLLQQVLAEHREALDCGATGVPAVRLESNPAVIVGAHPIALYRRWIEKTLDGSAG
jgi:predicted DsbA family dithiol-disulfide isomerase